MKADDLCPLCKKGHLKPIDEEYKLVRDNEECNWVETDAMAGLKAHVRQGRITVYSYHLLSEITKITLTSLSLLRFFSFLILSPLVERSEHA
jgi:hypothetical protein